MELARVELEDGRSVERKMPLTTELPAGTYVLSVRAAGHAPERAPFFVQPGESVTQRVDLIPAGRVPEGFVPIPAGRFLYGAAGDERVRRSSTRQRPSTR